MKQIPRIVAILIVLIVYGFVKPSRLHDNELRELSADFNFKKYELPIPEGIIPISIRETHPQYKNIAGWISSVGASIAFFDYDQDGLYNDLVHIDPRFNTVMILPSPSSKKRYEPFVLKIEGLKETMAPSGVMTYDFNEDGREDILVYFLGRSPLLFYNLIDGFKQDELNKDLVEEWDSTTGTIADFNGDGHPDILIANYFPEGSKLLHKNSYDTDQVMQHSMSKANNGGRNFIFLWKGVKEGRALFEKKDNWDNNIKSRNGWTLAVAAGDALNNDLLPEIYISNDFGPDKLLLNISTDDNLSFKELKGERGFTTIKSNVLGNDSFKGMGADLNDINNDGLLDIYVSNIADNYALHESHFMFINTGNEQLVKEGIAPYVNKSEVLGLSRSSWGWDSKLVDFNNDGIVEAVQASGFVKGENNRWPELQELATINDELIKNPKFWPNIRKGDDLSGDAHPFFFARDKMGKYYDISKYINLDYNKVTRGIAISDIDHDGKLDMAIASQWDTSYFFKNINTNNNNFIGLALKIPIKNKLHEIQINGEKKISRDAIGAIVKVKLKNGDTIIKYVDGGNGHSGRNSKEILIGLGQHYNKNDLVDVEIFWRNSEYKIKKEIIKLVPNQWYTCYLPF